MAKAYPFIHMGLTSQTWTEVTKEEKDFFFLVKKINIKKIKKIKKRSGRERGTWFFVSILLLFSTTVSCCMWEHGASTLPVWAFLVAFLGPTWGPFSKTLCLK